MMINRPKLILITGLTLALNLNGSTQVHAAGNGKSQSIRLTQAPTPDFYPQPATNLPALDWKPTPIAPAPNAPSPISPGTVPAPDKLAPVPDPNSQAVPPSTSSGVTTAPMPLGSRPNLAPRAPLGFHYGEQERLDALTNPPPRPLPTVPYPGNSGPALPPGTIAVPASPTLAADGTVVGDPAPGAVAADRFGLVPPPGTLGQTYKRRTRVLEDAKHPRVGVVEVNLPEGVDVTAVGLKSKWTGKVWRLESDALLPGIPHIYEIKASWGEGTEPQVRTVRLIMGRIVDLDF